MRTRRTPRKFGMSTSSGYASGRPYPRTTSPDSDEEDPPNSKGPSIDRGLRVTLEEINRGCEKNINMDRIVQNPDGSFSRFYHSITVQIPPGCPNGHCITIPDCGDQIIGSRPSDVNFIIFQEPHPHLQRVGCDVEYSAKITHYQLKRGTKMKVPTVFGESMWIEIKDHVVKRITNFGLPDPNEPGKRGDMIVKLEIEQPKRLTRRVSCF